MYITTLPKVDLHRHLELCVRHSTIRELAPQFQIDLPNEESFKERFLITQPMKDLNSVLNKFLDTQKFWSSTHLIERLAFEACEDAFRQDGIRILELRYAPTFIRQGHDHLSFEEIHQAIVKGVNRAEKEFPMAVGIICIIQRILPVKEAEAVTQFAIDHKETFIGLDLADNEVGFDSKPFAPFFLAAKKNGLGITVHSGEANVPNAPRYVREAIDYLGAQRIGHGVQIYRDPAVMEYVKEQNVILELCPTSNWLTQAIPDLTQHPFKKLKDFGIKTTINTDDPGIFNIDLNHEYKWLHEVLGLSVFDLEQCSDWAAKASFIDFNKKSKVWPRPIFS
ncbi:MAG: adenosine deaminase [Bdellovibrionales bacterium]|nr:adenosine deaminase [Bdellovibrionales bacterium]